MVSATAGDKDLEKSLDFESKQHNRQDSLGASSLRASGHDGDIEKGVHNANNMASPHHDAYVPSSPEQPSSADSDSAQPAASGKEELPQNALERSKLKTALIMLALCMAVFLAALDTTIITTALPTISEHFHSATGYTWVGSAYLLGAATAIPIWAKISDIWGRKPTLLGANVVFFVGSLVAALSYSIGMLITARAIQGIGGGGLIGLVNISIGDLFSMRVRGMYYGLIGCVWAIASATGPLLGGVFTQKVSWRWIFWVNLPIQGITFVIIIFLFKIYTPTTPLVAGLKAIDWLGCLLIVGGVIMFLLGLEFGGVSHPWASPTVICLLIFGVVSLTLFGINERYARYPLIPLHIFKYRSNMACLVVCFCHGFVFTGGAFYLPLYFQAVLGHGPIISGVLTLANALSLSFVSMAVGFTIRKTGQYLPPIWLGLFFMTVGFGLFIDLSATSSLAKIILYQIVAGVGVGPNFQAPLIALQSLVPPREIASAVATFQLTRNVSTAMSVVIGSVVFQNSLQKRYAQLAAALGPQLARQLSGFNAAASAGVVATLPPEQRDVARQVFAASLKEMWIMYTAVSAFGLLAGFAITKQVLTRKHEETKTGLEGEEAKRRERDERRRQKKALKSGAGGGAESPPGSGGKETV